MGSVAAAATTVTRAETAAALVAPAARAATVEHLAESKSGLDGGESRHSSKKGQGVGAYRKHTGLTALRVARHGAVVVVRVAGGGAVLLQPCTSRRSARSNGVGCQRLAIPAGTVVRMIKRIENTVEHHVVRAAVPVCRRGVSVCKHTKDRHVGWDSCTDALEFASSRSG